MRGSRSAWLGLFLICGLVAVLPTAHGDTLTFKQAVTIAAQHSSNVGIALADQMRAQGEYTQARSAYIPGAVIGSGLGKSWGFPLSLEGSAPSIFNVNASST